MAAGPVRSAALVGPLAGLSRRGSLADPVLRWPRKDTSARGRRPTTGAAKLVPSHMTYVTPSEVGMFGLQMLPRKPMQLPPRESGPVTRVLGATRSGLTTVVNPPYP